MENCMGYIKVGEINRRMRKRKKKEDGEEAKGLL